MIVNDVVELMEEIAPVALAETWDNVGLMLGHRDKVVKCVMLALDMTEQSVQQAIAAKADMLITHHPAIFNKLSNITDTVWQQSLLLRLAENGIAVYSAHTNLDCAIDGVNDVLAAALEMEQVETLDDSNGLGRIGYVKETCLDDFAGYVKNQLGSSYVTFASAGKNVHKLAICGGAGSDLIHIALAKGADTLLTGDVKYHSAQEAVFNGLNIIDAGHQPTELPVVKHLADKLMTYIENNNCNVKICVAQEELLLKVK